MARVKLYRLSETGQWDDRGTGHVSMEYLESSKALGLVVMSEEAHTNCLLVHKIYAEDIYQKQGADTIIMWTDPDLKTDLALSFQEAEGCNYIWTQMRLAQDSGRKQQREAAEGGGEGGAQGHHTQGDGKGAVPLGEGEQGQGEAGGGGQVHGRGGGHTGEALLDHVDASMVIAVSADDTHGHVEVGMGGAAMGRGTPLPGAACGGSPGTVGAAPGGGGDSPRRGLLADGYESALLQQHDHSHRSCSRSLDGTPVLAAITQLPTPDVAHLAELATLLQEASPAQQDHIVQLLLADGYVRGLMDAFAQAEDLEDTESLHNLFRIVRSMVLLNEGTLIELLVSDACVQGALGALEYDPEAPSKASHREFLQRQAVWKQVVPIANEEVVARIHQTFRVGYLKDVVLPRVLDDHAYSTLSSIMLFNYVEILTAFQRDNEVLPAVFRKLKSLPPASSEWVDLLLFLQEVCSQAKNLQNQQRASLFNSMVRLGLLDFVTTSLEVGRESPALYGEVDGRAAGSAQPADAADANGGGGVGASEGGGAAAAAQGAAADGGTDGGAAGGSGGGKEFDPEPLRLAGADVLMSVLMQDANTLRTFLADQPGHHLFSILIAELVSADDSGVQAQVLDAMRVLLDPDTMDQPADKNNFLDLFYEKYIGSLVDAVVWPHGKGEDSDAPVDTARAMMLGSVLDLLCFCVYAHTYRIKYYILRNNVVEKILRMLRRREAPLVLGAIRFMRTCIGRRDEFYYRYLIKNDLFGEVVAVFSRNGKRYNVLNSAVIEMVNFIAANGCTSLVRHLVERHWDALKEHDYVQTFANLKVKYDQIMARENHPGVTSGVVAAHLPPGTLCVGPNGLAAIAGEPMGVDGANGGDSESAGAMLALQALQPRAREARALEREEEVYFGESGGGGGGGEDEDNGNQPADDDDARASEFVERALSSPNEEEDGFVVAGSSGKGGVATRGAAARARVTGGRAGRGGRSAVGRGGDGRGAGRQGGGVKITLNVDGGGGKVQSAGGDAAGGGGGKRKRDR